MKELKILAAILIGISILSCSSDNNDTEEIDNENSEVISDDNSDEENDDEENDPIVGVWNLIRVLDVLEN